MVAVLAVLSLAVWSAAQQPSEPAAPGEPNANPESAVQLPPKQQAPQAPPASSLAPPPAPTQSAFKISENVNLVLLDVSVKDKQGGYVSGLPKEAFTVLEDGKPQQITQFADNDIPVTTGLVVDNSGSMTPKKPDVMMAALVFIQSSNPLDEWFVINFNDKVWRGLPPLIPFTDDIKLLRAALAKTEPAGRTALYDAILAGLRQLEMGRRDKKTLVVLSDGGDNASAHSLDEVREAVLRSPATIYTVGLFDEFDKEKNPDVLQKLAHISGGVCYLPKKITNVIDVCRQIAKDIRTRYTIGYVPQQLNRTGIRHIKVEVKAPGNKKLIARTRTSYAVRDEDSADRRKP
jgi:Ca-activated chloride channel family protein